MCRSGQAGEDHATVCHQVSFPRARSALGLAFFLFVLLTSGIYNLGDLGLSESLAFSMEHGTLQMFNELVAEQMLVE